jgi:hypoxanthine phosphoribosyltransferase
MRHLSWHDFDQAVERIAALLNDRSFSGIHGIPRGGLVLAVALSHRLELPLLPEPQPGCLVVDDVFETGRTLAPHRELAGSERVVWISKAEPEWWRAVEVTSSQEWIVFPWESAERATADERSYRAGLRQSGPMTNNDNFRYEPVERFGASMTSPRPWNKTALAGVELLNGRVAMLGFLAAIAGELLTGEGIVGQLALGLRLLLG